jgi:hypothetical protein
MILRGPDAVLDVTAECARANRAQPLGVIEKRQILFDLSVTEVVPVAEVRRSVLIKQRRQFTFSRDFFITTPAFEPQFDIFRSSVIDDAAQTIFHALEVNGRNGFTFLHRS